MDLQEILGAKIGSLADGPHLKGLQAVQSHIEAAVRHLQRGQTEGDDSLFSDVIFRCNQAFEGSVKEAYRILADKDPSKKTPNEIEKFLLTKKVLRDRVFAQLTRYRSEWRNPATHDYTLDFDEDEALMAIVSVSVFAIVLCDQIAAKIAFDAEHEKTSAADPLDIEGTTFLQFIATHVMNFANSHDDAGQDDAGSYYKLEGALAGYLSAALDGVDGIKIVQSEKLNGAAADISVIKDAERIVIELRRARDRRQVAMSLERGVRQVRFHMLGGNIAGGVVLVFAIRESVYEVANEDETFYTPNIKMVIPKAVNIK